MILSDNKEFVDWARLMIYDGRDRNVMMNDDNPTLCGYHFYMPPETAMIGMEKLSNLNGLEHDPIASWNDYKDVSHI